MRNIERLQLQLQEVRNAVQHSARKFDDQRKLLAEERVAVQEQVWHSAVWQTVTLRRHHQQQPHEAH